MGHCCVASTEQNREEASKLRELTNNLPFTDLNNNNFDQRRGMVTEDDPYNDFDMTCIGEALDWSPKN